MAWQPRRWPRRDADDAKFQALYKREGPGEARVPGATRRAPDFPTLSDGSTRPTRRGGSPTGRRPQDLAAIRRPAFGRRSGMKYEV